MGGGSAPRRQRPALSSQPCRTPNGLAQRSSPVARPTRGDRLLRRAEKPRRASLQRSATETYAQHSQQEGAGDGRHRQIATASRLQTSLCCRSVRPRWYDCPAEFLASVVKRLWTIRALPLTGCRTGSGCKRRTPKLKPGRMPRGVRLRSNRADLEPRRSDFAEPRRCQLLTSSLNTLQ